MPKTKITPAHLLLLSGFALLLRLLPLWYVGFDAEQSFVTYDSSDYIIRARNLETYDNFSAQHYPPFTHDTIRTPAYPLILAWFFRWFGVYLTPIILFQIMVSTGTVLLVYSLSKQCGFNQRAAYLAAFFFAIDPVVILISNRILTETIYSFLLVAMVWMYVKYLRTQLVEWLLGSGIILGLITLVRPIGLYIPLLLLPLLTWYFRTRKRTLVPGHIVLYVVMIFLIEVPWAFQNYQKRGVFSVATVSNLNLAHYRARSVFAAVHGITNDSALVSIQNRVRQQANCPECSLQDTIDVMRQTAMGIFSRYPLETVAMTARGLFRNLFDPGFSLICTHLDRTSISFDCVQGIATADEPGAFRKALEEFGKMSFLQQVVLVFSQLLLLTAYAGLIMSFLVKRGTQHWVSIVVLILLYFYFTGISAGGESHYRFRIPGLPMFYIAAALGIENRLARWFRYTR